MSEAEAAAAAEETSEPTPMEGTEEGEKKEEPLNEVRACGTVVHTHG